MTAPSSETSTVSMQHGHCPHCGMSLDGPPIWQSYMNHYGDADIADEIAAKFGATRERGRFGLRIAEIDLWSDRVVEFSCPECKGTWPT